LILPNWQPTGWNVAKGSMGRSIGTSVAMFY
jgi:hypothetical protein